MDSAEAPRIRMQFEALLLEPILEPLSNAFGEYGDIASAEFAEALARSMPS